MLVGIQLDLGEAGVNVLFNEAVLFEPFVNVVEFGVRGDVGDIDGRVWPLFGLAFGLFAVAFGLESQTLVR